MIVSLSADQVARIQIHVPFRDPDHPRHVPLDLDKADRFVEAMARGEVFPPPIVHRRGDGFLETLDGRHRVTAAQALRRGLVCLVAPSWEQGYRWSHQKPRDVPVMA